MSYGSRWKLTSFLWVVLQGKVIPVAIIIRCIRKMVGLRRLEITGTAMGVRSYMVQKPKSVSYFVSLRIKPRGLNEKGLAQGYGMGVRYIYRRLLLTFNSSQA